MALCPGARGMHLQVPQRGRACSAQGPSWDPGASMSLTPQGTTYLQELDAVARSPDGENEVRARGGTLKQPSPPAPVQARDRGDLFPGGESWMLWGGWVFTFPFNSKGFSSTHGVRNCRSSPGPATPPAAAPSLLVLAPRRHAA